MRNNLIYICNNNGSDTRVSKEIDTLSRHFGVHFLGFEKDSHHERDYGGLSSYNLVQGAIRNPRSLFFFCLEARRLLVRFPEASVHIVNEQLAAILMPLIFRRHVVIDSFDSMFLRMNLPGNRAQSLKKMVYGPARSIIVTDVNRFNLLPDVVKEKSVIIPNVPRRSEYPEKTRNPDLLTLCYFGSLAEKRGSRFIKGMLDTSSSVRCIAAGWAADDYTRDLLRHERIEFLGSLPQKDVNAVLAEKGDYLVAVYPLDNQNNVNASPNKIYDAIHTKTPLIITSGVIASEFVQTAGIGLAIDTEKDLDFHSLFAELMNSRDRFSFSDSDIFENSWEAFEDMLCAVHK